MLERKVAAIRLLADTEIERIHATSLEVLEKIGYQDSQREGFGDPWRRGSEG